MPVMAVHSHRSTWQPPHALSKKRSPPARPLTQSPNAPLDKPLPPPPLFAFADFDTRTDTLGATRPSTKTPLTSNNPRPVSPIPAELKRADSGVAIDAIELEDSFSSFVASSPSIFKDSVLGGITKGSGFEMSASPPSVDKRRSSSGVRNKRKSMGPRLPVRVMSAESNDTNGGLNEPSLKVVERPLTPGDSSVCVVPPPYLKHVSHRMNR